MKKKEDVKTLFIKVRVSAKEKEQITKYAEEHDMTVSELIRAAITRYAAIEEEKGE